MIRGIGSIGFRLVGLIIHRHTPAGIILENLKVATMGDNKPIKMFIRLLSSISSIISSISNNYNPKFFCY